MRPLGRPFSWVARQLNAALPGGGSVVWIALVLSAIAVTVAVVIRFARARSTESSNHSRPLQEMYSANELERLSDEAEGNGHFGEAVRLRFRAGLRRLGDGRAVRIPNQRPNGELVRQLDDPAFALLASRFDEIAYADRPGTPDDVINAKQNWPPVIAAGIARTQQRHQVIATTSKKRRRRSRA